MTISNAFLNISNDDDGGSEDGKEDEERRDAVAKRCRFLSGDWSLMETFLNDSSQTFTK